MSINTNGIGGYRLYLGEDGPFALACRLQSRTSYPFKANYNSTLAIIITGVSFLSSGIAGLKNRNYPTDLGSLLSMGFGAVQPKAFVGFITSSVCIF